MEVGMTGVGVELVRMQRQVGMRDRASLILVLVAMRVAMRAAVTVRVDVHCVGVVVVNGPIRVGNISVILIRRIRVIAMAAVQMIYVGHIQVVVVRGGIGCRRDRDGAHPSGPSAVGAEQGNPDGPGRIGRHDQRGGRCRCDPYGTHHRGDRNARRRCGH